MDPIDALREIGAIIDSYMNGYGTGEAHSHLMEVFDVLLEVNYDA